MNKKENIIIHNFQLYNIVTGASCWFEILCPRLFYNKLVKITHSTTAIQQRAYIFNSHWSNATLLLFGYHFRFFFFTTVIFGWGDIIIIHKAAPKHCHQCITENGREKSSFSIKACIKLTLCESNLILLLILLIFFSVILILLRHA